eukprot:10981758-Karenia_brevis.AAC.1
MAERLVTMGFPMTDELAMACGGRRISVEPGEATVMAGNAMHLANVSACAAVMLGGIKIMDR